MIRFLFSTVRRKELRLSNLPKHLDEQEIGQFLNTFTKVTQVKVLREETGRSKGVAFAKLAHESSLESALTVKERILEGRKVYIEPCLTQE